MSSSRSRIFGATYQGGYFVFVRMSPPEAFNSDWFDFGSITNLANPVFDFRVIFCMDSKGACARGGTLFTQWESQSARDFFRRSALDSKSNWLLITTKDELPGHGSQGVHAAKILNGQ